MSAQVALVKGDDRAQNITDALELIEDQLSVENKKNILIKPNLTALDNVYANTDVIVTQALIEFLNERFGEKRITIGEGSGSAFSAGKSTRDVFRTFGYVELAKRYDNVILRDFNEANDFFTIPVSTVHGEDEIRVTEEYRDYDYVISLAIPKTHDYAIATLSMKNMMGLIEPSDRIKIHGLRSVSDAGGGLLIDLVPAPIKHFCARHVPRRILALFRAKSTYKQNVKLIHKNLLAFFKEVKPDLAIVDGFYGMEGDGPVAGEGIELGMAIASTDPVKADALSAKIMGFEPEEIGYLYYCHQGGVGTITLDDVVGADINEVRKSFRPHRDYGLQREWQYEH